MKRHLVFLGVLLLMLSLAVGVSSAKLYTVVDSGQTYIEYQDEDGVPLLIIDDDEGVTVTSSTAWYTLFDDFMWFTEGDIWATTEDADKTGTDGIMDVVGGVYQNYCDGDDNDESYCISAGESFKFATGKKLWFEARLRVDEANTDDANVIVGLMDNAGADALLDNGGGPAASYDGAVFCKVDGGTKWQFETSNASDQETTAEVAAYADDTFVKLGFYFDGATSITPYVNGTAGTAHTISLTGLEEMHLFFGIKAGGTNEESIEIDYVLCTQLR